VLLPDQPDDRPIEGRDRLRLRDAFGREHEVRDVAALLRCAEGAEVKPPDPLLQAAEERHHLVLRRVGVAARGDARRGELHRHVAIARPHRRALAELARPLLVLLREGDARKRRNNEAEKDAHAHDCLRYLVRSRMLT
jgi:hypothetical protein